MRAGPARAGQRDACRRRAEAYFTACVRRATVRGRGWPARDGSAGRSGRRGTICSMPDATAQRVWSELRARVERTAPRRPARGVSPAAVRVGRSRLAAAGEQDVAVLADAPTGAWSSASPTRADRLDDQDRRLPVVAGALDVDGHAARGTREGPGEQVGDRRSALRLRGAAPRAPSCRSSVAVGRRLRGQPPSVGLLPGQRARSRSCESAPLVDVDGALVGAPGQSATAACASERSGERGASDSGHSKPPVVGYYHSSPTAGVARAGQTGVRGAAGHLLHVRLRSRRHVGRRVPRGHPPRLSRGARRGPRRTASRRTTSARARRSPRRASYQLPDAIHLVVVDPGVGGHAARPVHRHLGRDASGRPGQWRAASRRLARRRHRGGRTRSMRRRLTQAAPRTDVSRARRPRAGRGRAGVRRAGRATLGIAESTPRRLAAAPFGQCVERRRVRRWARCSSPTASARCASTSPRESIDRLGLRAARLEVGLGHNTLDVPFGRTFSDVAEGEPVALVDSSGWLTLAVNLGERERPLRRRCPGARVRVRAL